MIQNIIAMLYDFDMTLSPTVMQEPIFEDPRFKISSKDFWNEVNEFRDEQGKEREIQSEAGYLHQILQMSQKGGKLEGLTREAMRELGKKVQLFPGLPEFFTNVKKDIEQDENYKKYDIKIEHYVASTGMAEMLRESPIAQYMEHISASEFFYDEQGVPVGVAFMVTHTQKTETIYKINKGVFHNKEIDINSFLPKEARRIPTSNMIYFGDGPSDVPCMSIIKRDGGFAFAVYNPEPFYDSYKKDPARHAFSLKRAGRVDFCAEADYRKNSHLYRMTLKSLREIANRIVDRNKTALKKGLVDAPHY